MHVKLFMERIPVHVPLVWRKPSLPRNRSADLASPAYNFNSDRAECAEDTALRVGAFQLIRLDAQKWLKNTCARGPGKKLWCFLPLWRHSKMPKVPSACSWTVGLTSRLARSRLPGLLNASFQTPGCCGQVGDRVYRCSLLWLQIRCSKHLTHFSVAGHIIMATTNSTVLLSQILDEYVVFRFVRAVKFFRHLKYARRCKIGSYCTPALTYQASWTFYSKIPRCQTPGRCYVQGLRWTLPIWQQNHNCGAGAARLRLPSGGMGMDGTGLNPFGIQEDMRISSAPWRLLNWIWRSSPTPKGSKVFLSSWRPLNDLQVAQRCPVM